MNVTLETALAEAWRSVRSLSEVRESKILSAAHVASLQKAQAHLLTARAAISKQLDHISLLLQAAGASGAGVREHKTLTEELREVRSMRGTR